MTRPTAAELASKIVAFVQEGSNGIAPIKKEDFDSDWRKSGVYAVLDCVLSARAKFETMVQPALRRFSENSGLADTPSLTFSHYLNFVKNGEGHRPSAERFEEVAREVFRNRQKISGRLKVEVVYDVCEFFVAKGLETKQDLKGLSPGLRFSCEHPGEPGELEGLVMDQIVNGSPPEGKVRGMGLALGAYLLICLGDTSFVKPDALLLRRVGKIGDWEPKASNTSDFQLIRQAITCAADRLGTVPAHLDHVLWKYESERGQSSSVSKRSKKAT